MSPIMKEEGRLGVCACHGPDHNLRMGSPGGRRVYLLGIQTTPENATFEGGRAEFRVTTAKHA